MKPKPSPLEIIDIAITQFNYSFIPSKKDGDITSYFKKYEIDIDFTIHGNDYLMVQLKANVNKIKEPLPGYSLMAEVTCVFNFDKKQVNVKEIRENIEGYSTLYITLNSLRGLISSFTSNAPWGRYILPSIDLNDLIEKKRKMLNEMQEKNTSNTKDKKPEISIKSTKLKKGI